MKRAHELSDGPPTIDWFDDGRPRDDFAPGHAPGIDRLVRGMLALVLTLVGTGVLVAGIEALRS